jgi:proteasome lid subunit RPN8/RPN11
MLVITPKRIRRELSAVAKAAYPNEIFAFLLGNITNDAYEIQKLYFPEAVESKGKVSIELPQAISEAMEEAAEDNLYLLGDIHSHPGFIDASPSEHDWDSNEFFKPYYIKSPIMGILAVFQHEKYKFKTRLRYWPWLKDKICQKS